MSKSILLGIAAIAGVSTPAAAGLFYQTQETIWVIPNQDETQKDESLNNIWETLKTTLKTTLKNKNVKDTKLQEIKSDSSDAKGDKLKKWCFEKYQETYWNWITPENKDLEQDVKNACGISIGEKLNGSKLTIPSSGTSSNETKLKEKVKKLKEHKPNQGHLEKKLKRIKDSEKPEEKWKDLENWCKEAYEQGYQGDKSNKWKLASLYCKQD